MRTVLIGVPIRPFVIRSLRNFFRVRISAIGTGEGLNARRHMRSRLGNDTIIKIMRCGLAFVTDTEADMGGAVGLVFYPLAPLVLCEHRDILFLGSLANGADIEHRAELRVCRRYVYNTVTPFTILGLDFVAGAGSRVRTVLIGVPIRPFVIRSLRNFFRVRISAIGTGEGLNARRHMRSRLGNDTIIKIMRCGLAFVTDTIADMGIRFVLLIDFPIAPSVFLGQLAFADITGRLMVRAVNGRRVAPFVSFDLLRYTAISLTVADVRVIVKVLPFSPVVIKGGNIFCLCSITIGASEGLYARFGAGGSLGFYTVVPSVRCGLGDDRAALSRAGSLVIFVTVGCPFAPDMLVDLLGYGEGKFVTEGAVKYFVNVIVNTIEFAPRLIIHNTFFYRVFDKVFIAVSIQVNFNISLVLTHRKQTEICLIVICEGRFSVLGFAFETVINVNRVLIVYGESVLATERILLPFQGSVRYKAVDKIPCTAHHISEAVGHLIAQNSVLVACEAVLTRKFDGGGRKIELIGLSFLDLELFIGYVRRERSHLHGFIPIHFTSHVFGQRVGMHIQENTGPIYVSDSTVGKMKRELLLIVITIPITLGSASVDSKGFVFGVIDFEDVGCLRQRIFALVADIIDIDELADFFALNINIRPIGSRDADAVFTVRERLGSIVGGKHDPSVIKFDNGINGYLVFPLVLLAVFHREGR